MTNDETVLKLISEITEFNDMSEFMQDEQLDKAMAAVVKLMMTPDVPHKRALTLMVELQAMATKFSMLKVYYMTIAKDKAGTVNNHKKNIYMTASDAINRLVDVVKYSARYGE